MTDHWAEPVERLRLEREYERSTPGWMHTCPSTDGDTYSEPHDRWLPEGVPCMFCRQQPPDGLPACEGWVCQSCGADNFIPEGFARVTPPSGDPP